VDGLDDGAEEGQAASATSVDRPLSVGLCSQSPVTTPTSSTSVPARSLPMVSRSRAALATAFVSLGPIASQVPVLTSISNG
jgi:hypothetical protein